MAFTQCPPWHSVELFERNNHFGYVTRRSCEWKTPESGAMCHPHRGSSRHSPDDMRENGWNISRTSEVVGLARESLSRKLRSLKIDVDKQKEPE